jgi:hypothetical protein
MKAFWIRRTEALTSRPRVPQPTFWPSQTQRPALEMSLCQRARPSQRPPWRAAARLAIAPAWARASLVRVAETAMGRGGP